MKKFEIPSDIKWRFRVRKPGGQHTSFRVIKQSTKGKKTVNETVADKRIDKINKRYKKGVLNVEGAIKLLDTLLVTLYKEAGVRVFKAEGSSDNKVLLEEFFNEEYSDRHLVDPLASYHDYARAIDLLGLTSLQTASQKEIQKTIDKNCGDDVNRQRRTIRKIRTLLTWLGRSDVKLRTQKAPRSKVAYINFEDFEKVVKELDEHSAIQAKMALYTGCRIGELYALNGYSWLGKDTVRVESQIDKHGNERDTKNRSTRLVYFLGKEKLFREWIDIKDEIPVKIRKQASSILKTACKQAKKKPIRFHDLRHSYAIHLIRSGINLTLVAQALGNTIKVTERHYTGFTLTDETIETIRRQLRKN